MSKEITRTLALAALAIIVENEAKIDVLAEQVKAKREELDKHLRSLKQVRLDGGEHEAVRYLSTSYSVNDEALVKAIRANAEALELLMPRSAVTAKVREVIDGKTFPALKNRVRACCTKHSEWRLKVQKAKRKAEAVSEVSCAAG